MKRLMNAQGYIEEKYIMQGKLLIGILEKHGKIFL